MSNPIPDLNNPRPATTVPQSAPTASLLGVEFRNATPPKVQVGPESVLHTGLNVMPLVGAPGSGAVAPAVTPVVAAFRPGVNPIPAVDLPQPDVEPAAPECDEAPPTRP